MGGTTSRVEPESDPLPLKRPIRDRKKREDSNQFNRKISLPVVPETEEENMKDISKSSNTDTNGIQAASKGELQKTNYREITKTTNYIESDVSILISNASEEDSDSIQFTIQDGFTSTPLLLKKRSVSNVTSSTDDDNSKNVTEKKGDNAKIVTDKKGDNAKSATDKKGDNAKSVTDKKGDNAKSVTDKKGDNVKSVTDKKGDNVKSVTDKNGDNAKSVTDKKGDNVKDWTETKRLTNRKDDNVKHKADKKVEHITTRSDKKVENNTTRSDKKIENNTTRSDKTEENKIRMGSNVSTMERKISVSNERESKISRERKLSTDIAKIEYMYRTSQDKVRQRHRPSNPESPKRKITATKYPNTMSNGDIRVSNSDISMSNGDVLTSNGDVLTSNDDVLIIKDDFSKEDIVSNNAPSTASPKQQTGSSGPREVEQHQDAFSNVRTVVEQQEQTDSSDRKVDVVKPEDMVLSRDQSKHALKTNLEKRVRINSPDPIRDATDFYNRLSMRMERSNFIKEPPSVSLFAQTFQEYVAMGIEVPTDDSGLIIPSPPITKKIELLKSLDFKTIDIHASRVPQKMMEKSLAEMTRFLIKPAGGSRIERIRAIFVWLVTTDLDSLDLESDEEEASEEEDETQTMTDQFLQEVKDDHLSLAELFKTMCRIAGIHCRTIDGISREYMEQPSKIVTETATATWSAVVIQQSWRLVDVSKAAVIYKALRDNLQGLQQEKSSDSLFGNSRSPITDIVDFYFLTDPEQFVFTNLPEEENFQFLPRPVTYAEFTYLPFIKPHFFILRFQEVDQYESVTEITDGRVVYLIRSPEAEIRKLACSFHKVEGKSNTLVNSSDLRDYVYVESDMKTGYFTVKVKVPVAGTYVLEINGRSGLDTTDCNNGLCSYVIKSSRSFRCEPYCVNDREEWGPGSDCYLIGLTPVSHLGGAVSLQMGFGVVEFEMDNPVSILHTLSHRELQTSHLANYVIHRFEDSKIFIHIRVPKSGEYALKIFARKEAEDGVFVNICTYLVCSTDDVSTDPYPKVDDGLVGTNQFFNRLNMTIIRPKMCILNTPENGNIKFKLNLAPNVHYLPEFKLCRNNEETAMHEYTTWSLVDLMGTFRLKFPQQGTYLFSLYAILPNVGDQVNAVYNAVITCNWPSERCFPYALSLASWTPYYRLLSPKDLYLVSGTVVKFLVDISDALRVSVIGNSGGWQHLEKQEDGLWANTISIEPSQEGKPIKMFASIEDSCTSMFSLVQFKVVSKDDMTEMETVQKQYYQKALERVEHLKKAGEWADPDIVLDEPPAGEIDDGISEICVEDAVVVDDFSEVMNQESLDNSPKSPRKSVKPGKKKSGRLKSKKKRNKSKLGLKSENDATMDTSASSGLATEQSTSKTSPKKEDSELYESSDVSDDEYDSDVSDDDSWKAKMAEFEEWKKQSERAEKKADMKQIKAMKVQLIVNRLRGATRRKDKLELIRAIDDWKALGYKKCKENTQAERMLDVINLRDDLNTHLKNRNVQSLKTALNEVEFKGYVSEIPYEVSQARSRIFLTNNHSPQRHHRQTTIDVQTLAEIRSYIRPPEVVHQIVVAMLLLMGVPEKNTKKWKKCQKRCVVSGKHGLHSRLHEVQPEDIDRSIAARAAELLDSHTFSEADAVSPGVGALFIWVNQIIDAVEECNKGRETPVTPARRRKQNEIFREETELSEDILHIHDDHSYSQQFVLREKTQSHFKTQSKSRLATRDTKSGKLADGKKSRSRSRPDRARGGGKQEKPNEKSKPHK